MALSCRIRYNLESIQRVVEWMALYTIFRNSDGNRYVLYLYWNDGKWNWNYNWLDNQWNANNPSAVLATISFLSSCRRVLFYQLPMPSTKHSADLIQRYRNLDILFVINRLTLPEYE